MPNELSNPVFTLRHIDTCLSDYFCGSPNVVLMAIVDGATTAETVWEQLLEDFMQTSDERLENVEDDHFIAVMDEWFAEHYPDRNVPFDSRLEVVEGREDAPNVIAYFDIRFEDE